MVNIGYNNVERGNKMFKRKAYDDLLRWKKQFNGTSAALIEGARRVGKSTIAEEFAKNEYKSYIKIDFSNTSKEIKSLFEDISDLDFFFRALQSLCSVELYKRDSVIIFDEVQLFPIARQAIKHLVADGRYDYIETGSLISIKKNVKDILIPSEEYKIKVYPMDIEEFFWATNELVYKNIVDSFKVNKIGEALNRKFMRDMRTYIAVGGMPQAVVAYTEKKSFAEIDSIKKSIIELYLNDFARIDDSGRLAMIYKDIPAQLALGKTRFVISSATNRKKTKSDYELISQLLDSQTVLSCNAVTDPSFMLEHTKSIDEFKFYLSDVGLFVSMLFNDSSNNDIYNRLLFDKIDANLGYLYENVVAQMITASGHGLYYYTWGKENSTHKYEIDFLLSSKNKIIPLEIKSGQSLEHKSLDAFMDKYSNRIEKGYILSKYDIREFGNVTNYPIYCLKELINKYENK